MSVESRQDRRVVIEGVVQETGEEVKGELVANA